jgi:hypothetical protein
MAAAGAATGRDVAVMRRLALALALVLGVAGAAAAQAPVPAGVAQLRQAVDLEIRGLTSTATAAEAVWRASFVGPGRLDDGTPRGADEVLLSVRKAVEAAEDLRRTVTDLDERRSRGQLDVAAFTDQLLEQGVTAVLERWGLHKDEAANIVELARRRYATAIAGGRVPAAREAQARTRATQEHQRATAALRTARDTIVADLGAWLARARQLGRQAAADSIAERIDAHLNATPRGATGATSLDAYLKAQSVPFEAAPAGTPAVTMDGAFASIDVGRLGVAPQPPQLRFIKAGAGGWDNAAALAFGGAAYVEATGDDSGPDERVAELTWPGGRESTTLRRRGKGTWRSDAIIVWPPPGGRAAAAPPAPAPAGIGGINILDAPPAHPEGGVTGSVTAPPAQAGPDDALASFQAEIARRQAFKLETIPVDLAATPPVFRAKAVEYRQYVDRMRARLFIAELPAETTQKLAAFRTQWADLVDPITTGRRPTAPLAATRWTELAASFDLSKCKNLAAPRDGRLSGPHWACLSDAFFRKAVELDATVDQATDRERAQKTGALEQAMRDVEKGFEPASRPGPSEFERARWRREMTFKLHLVWLEGAQKALEAMQKRRELASREDTPHRWFRALGPRLGSVPPPPRGATRLTLAPGTTVTASLDGASQQVRVEATAPTDPGGFFARALYDVHEESRQQAAGAAAELEPLLRAYDAGLEERYGTPDDPHLQAPAAAELRRQAVEQYRAQLEASRATRLSEAAARLASARERAITAIESLR